MLLGSRLLAIGILAKLPSHYLHVNLKVLLREGFRKQQLVLLLRAGASLHPEEGGAWLGLALGNVQEIEGVTARSRPERWTTGGRRGERHTRGRRPCSTVEDWSMRHEVVATAAIVGREDREVVWLLKSSFAVLIRIKRILASTAELLCFAAGLLLEIARDLLRG